MNKKIFIPAAVILVIILIGLALYYVWKSSSLQIVSTTPKNNEITLGTSAIDFNFSKDINEVEFEKNIEDPNKIISGISLKDTKTLSIKLGELSKDTKYSITLKNITSKDGDILKEYKFDFYPRAIDFKDLSEEEKRRQIEETDKNTYQDPLENALPYETNNYKITYLTPSEDTDVPATITITMKFFEPGDEALPATTAEKQEYLNNIRKYRTEAIDYLKSNGIDVNNYVMEYTELDLRDEFPPGYQPQQDF
jgi:hypothetical protein